MLKMAAPLDPPGRRDDPEPAGPLSLDEAAETLARHRRAHPRLWAPPEAPGVGSGATVYRPDALPWVFCNAVKRVNEWSGRIPDIVRPRLLSDHYTAYKFFAPVRVQPINPADKLASHRYLPKRFRDRIYVPQRLWSSRRHRLPEDAALPPGRYFLKSAMASDMNRAVNWPPSAEERRRLEKLARGWLRTTFGADWGEWWYAMSPNRIFLEEDLAHEFPDGLEIKVFVRDGVVVFYYAIRHHPGAAHEVAFHTPDHRYLEGRNIDRLPLKDFTPPPEIDDYLAAAAAIGRRHGVCRVDFLVGRTVGPILGEITLCHMDGRIAYTREKDDLRMSRMLFGRPGPAARLLARLNRRQFIRPAPST